MRTRGARLHCLRMASYVKAKSQIFLTASLAVLTVECRTDAQDSDAIVIDGAALVQPVACELRHLMTIQQVFNTEAVEASRQQGYRPTMGSVP